MVSGSCLESDKRVFMYPTDAAFVGGNFEERRRFEQWIAPGIKEGNTLQKAAARKRSRRENCMNRIVNQYATKRKKGAVGSDNSPGSTLRGLN